MSNIKEIYLTNDGLAALQKELDFLKNEKRAEVITALKEARSLGDLSENAEYDAARNEQAQVESKIQELEAMIENAIVISEVKTDQVSIGTTVKIKYVEDGETDVYSIVGSKEADPFGNKISNESPIAQAIMGHKAGTVVTVDSPNGKYDVEILEIS
jgi:transcription elongation factor GreA